MINRLLSASVLKVLLTVLFTVLLSCSMNALADPGQFIQPNNLYPKVLISTTLGDIEVELDRSRAPITVNNFLSYVKEKRYNNTLFHRLEPDYVVQGGGYNTDFRAILEREPIINESGNGLKNQYATIAMARLNDPHSATSQFFFNLKDNANLDPGSRWGYTVFGRITGGETVLETMRQQATDVSVALGWPNVPVEPIVIKMITVLAEPEL
ncbi:peptidylprolyl isomerase [Rheinheimera salexigens]|uniref:Peptidyl-prolyl cis-trans isomerase n=1 Tax=Rheinheimera salexigens TaxID=1628148 RepID=A0A1E7Q4G4_9GAMM|nr:peptidylprolyl isomerase [Rheinheimera salexigens]OEY69065.1 peptidylprolyl isomerase [Rheinheimera salexigens]